MASELASLVRSHLKFILNIKAKFNEKDFLFSPSHLNYLLDIATNHHSMNVFVSLLQIPASRPKIGKTAYFTLSRTFLRATKSPMFEIDRQNLVYFFRNSLFISYKQLMSNVLIKEIPDLDLPVNSKNVAFPFYAAIELRQNDLPGLQKHLADLCQIVSDMPINTKSLSAIGGLLRIVANIGMNKQRLLDTGKFIQFPSHPQFDSFDFHLEQKTLYAYHLCLIELSRSMDTLCWRLSDHLAIRVANHKFQNHITEIVTQELIDQLFSGYISILKGAIKPNFVFKITLPRLLHYIKEIKGFKSPAIEAAERYVATVFPGWATPGIYPKDILSTSTTIIELERLLLSIPKVTIEREKQHGPFSIDIMVWIDGKPAFAIECDGPIHFLANGTMTSPSHFRNFCLLKAGIKVVSLRLDYFEVAMAMGQELNLLQTIIKMMQTQRLILVGFEGNPYAVKPPTSSNAEDQITEPY
jgi:hypothetical protein